jgi:non-heme chloroperoxidase
MTHTMPWRSLAAISIAAFLVAAVSAPGLAQEPKFKAVSVKTPDGLTISAQDWGNANGPEILFIHGFSQSHLSWIKQVTGRRSRQGIPHGDLRPARPRQF